MTTADAPILNIDPFSIENLTDPQAFFVALRETAPVVWLPQYEVYATGRHAEVRTILGDFAAFTSTGGIGMSDIRKPGAWRSASPITEIDPPQHTEVRAAMTRILSPLVIRQWREHFVAEAERIAEEAVDKGDIDAVPDLVEAFVLKVFPDVLGVDMPRQNFLAIGEMNFNQIGPNNDLTRAAMAKVDGVVLEQFTRGFQREGMLPGGFGEKIYQAEDEGFFAKGTAGPQVRSFLRAGVDTTIAGIGHALHLLAAHPDQWALLKAEPARVKGAFEEALRLESPSSCIFRTTTQGGSFAGLDLRPDTKIALFLGAANRDPAQFPDPDRFDITRESAGVHVGLGAGPHICIGQMIARLEAECLLSALLRRVSRIELTGAAHIHPINTLRTLGTLPLRLHRL